MPQGSGYKLWYINDHLQPQEVNIEKIPRLSELLSRTSFSKLTSTDQDDISSFLQQGYDGFGLQNPFAQAPELFADDLSLGLSDITHFMRKDREEGSCNPGFLVTFSPPKTVQQLILQFDGIGSRHPCTHYRLYMSCYLARETTSSLTRDLLYAIPKDRGRCEKPYHRPPKRLYDLIQWLIVCGIIDEHRRILIQLSHKAPERLVSLDQELDNGRGRWTFNPAICEPLMLYLKAFDQLFKPDNPVGDYLKKLDTTTIHPLETELKRLQALKRTQEVAARIEALDQLLRHISELITRVLQSHLHSTKGQFLDDDIYEILDPTETSTVRERIQSREIDHQTLLEQLQQDLNPLLIGLPEILSQADGTFNIESFFEKEYHCAKQNFSEEIKNIKIPIQKEKAAALLKSINAIERREKNKKQKSYAMLTQTLNLTTTALRAPTITNGSKLVAQGKKIQGCSALSWKIVGGVLMVLGVAIMVGGILIAIGTALPTSGLGLGGGLGIAAGGFALSLAGAGLFQHGRGRWLPKAMQAFGENLEQTAAPAPSVPGFV